MNVLITGGAGYIGSTVVWMFIDRGHDVTIIDNLKMVIYLIFQKKCLLNQILQT